MTNPYSQPIQPEQPKKKGSKLTWIAGGAAVLIVGGALASGGSEESATTAQPAESASVEKVAASESAAGLGQTLGELSDALGGGSTPDDGASAEHHNALRAAKRYVQTMAFSQAKLYDQLTSDYGEKYTYEEAQQAVDSLGL